MDLPSDFDFASEIELANKIATAGRRKAVGAAFMHLTREGWQKREDFWYLQTILGLTTLTCAEYDLLTEANRDTRQTAVPLLAWRARNLLELTVWAIYCKNSPSNVRRLFEDAGRDANDLFNAFQKWGQATSQDADFNAGFVDARKQLADRAASVGIEELDAAFLQVSAAAREVGMADNFRVSFKLLSKWAHPTQMHIIGVSDAQKIHAQRTSFFGLGCLHFNGAFHAIEDIVLPLSEASA